MRLDKDKKIAPVLLSDYKEPKYSITSTELVFDLFDDKTIVESTIKYKKTDPSSTKLILNGEKLELLEVKIDDEIITAENYSCDAKYLTIETTDLNEEFSLYIKNSIDPAKNSACVGLYKTNNLYCTQMEAQGFRFVTYFQDRPDVLSIYTTTIRADKSKYPQLLSNGNLLSTQDLEKGRHEAIWSDPFAKPCYLFALVAGDLASVEDTFITQSGRTIDLKIFVDKGNESRCTHAMNSLKAAMKWDESKYGLEYDLDLFMIVAVSDFNMGAMENKGLNIFNDAMILADIESTADYYYQGIFSIVGHEYFHNWSGNRVTCRDWFQLSLKEGFTVYRDQQFTEDHYSKQATRLSSIRYITSSQFDEDNGPLSHPVKPETYLAIDNFYTSTVYNKGAELIRMINSLVGEKKYYTAVKNYFKNNDGLAVTIEDFIIEFSEIAPEIDFEQFKLWYSQRGTPVLTVNENYDTATNKLSLEVKQKTIDPITQQTNKPYLIPIKIMLIDKHGKILSEETTVNLTKETQTFEFEDIKSRPVVSFLRQFSAPVKINFQQSVADQNSLALYDNDIYNRLYNCQKLYTNEIKSIYVSILEQKEHTIGAHIFSLYEDILNISLKDDLESIAHLLAVDGISKQLSEMEDVEIEVLYRAITEFKTQVATKFEDKIVALYKLLYSQNHKDLSSIMAMNQRLLKNDLLALLSYCNKDEYLELIYTQFNTASNMSDSLTAFSLLIKKDNKYRDNAIAAFLNKWQDNERVLQKWFSTQASSRHNNTFENVKKLLTHEKYKSTNPNFISSLLKVFSLNLKTFNTKSGAEYKFYVDQILKIDKANRFAAAGLLKSFRNINSFCKHQRDLVKSELERVIQSPDISTNLMEIATLINKAIK